MIHTANHEFDDAYRPATEQGWRDDGPVTIGRNCWIGMGSIILPGVTIGEGCVVGAGSLVSRDIPPFSVAVGHPARVIRERPH
jgi:acetyltransferase-like isoleucine patch superfamily enzyme